MWGEKVPCVRTENIANNSSPNLKNGNPASQITGLMKWNCAATYEHPRPLKYRDVYPYQNEWIFGQVPKGEGGGGGSKVSCFPMCPVLIFLFKLLKNIPWKYPFVSFLCQKSPVQKSKFCNINFWIGNDPPPLRNFSENSSVLVGGCFPKQALSFLDL